MHHGISRARLGWGLADAGFRAWRTGLLWAIVVAAIDCTAATALAQGQADLVIVNAKIFEPTNAGLDALAIKADRILAVGLRADVQPLIGPKTMLLDAKGGTVTPGFNDAHVHFLSGSLSLNQIDLADVDSLAAIETKIKSFADAHPGQAWITGRGWVYGTFPGGLPHKSQLDRVLPDRPAMMRCYDGHTLWVNSKALQAANITKETPDPTNGIIVRDPVTNEPTGVLKENAQTLVEKVMPEPARSEKLAALRSGIEVAHRYGVTSVQEAGSELAELELFDNLRSTDQLPLRFTFALAGRPQMTEADADLLTSLKRRFPLLRITSVKLYIDGVIEAHTAALLSPYANRPSLGQPETSAEDLNRIVAMLDRRGWQIMIHAIGDGGIRLALDAFEHASQVNPPTDPPRRHRLEHIESISSQDIARFGRLGVIASMQPYHANPNGNIFNVWAANLGSERASRAWVWKSIQDAGGRLAFGSDWPVVSIDPRLGMHVALTRQTLQGAPPDGFIAEQRLPLRSVLDAYTRGAAVAEFSEAQKGTLAPGMLADIVLWNQDLFSLPANQVHTAKVATTIFNGRVVYQGD